MKKPTLSATSHLALALVAVLALLAAACGGAASPTTTVSTLPGPATTTTTTSPPTTITTSTVTTTGQVTTTSLSTSTSTTAELPGEPTNFGPKGGSRLAVMGVAFDDVLNVRVAPGANQTIVHELSPLADDIIATGHNRTLPQSIWYQVEVDGVTGWVSGAFVGYPGPVDDATAQIVQILGGIPEATNMLELGRSVAEGITSVEPPIRITVTVAPTVGDLGEVTFDVVGLEDDAVAGFRLHIFGAPSEGGFYLDSVEMFDFCSRGVDPDGFCV
jgi:Bacterial SH3 domain